MTDLSYIITRLIKEVKYESLLILLVLSMGLVACDPYHKKQCEWVLTAEPEGIKMMSKMDVENIGYQFALETT